MMQQPPSSAKPDVSDDSPPPVAPLRLICTAVTAPGVRSVVEVSTLIEQSAHDLRSSLNAIRSWTYVLKRTVDATPISSCQLNKVFQAAVRGIVHVMDSIR